MQKWQSYAAASCTIFKANHQACEQEQEGVCFVVTIVPKAAIGTQK